MCGPARQTGVSASPCLDADGSLAGKSTGRQRPIVSGCVRLFQKVSESSDAAASRWSKRPRREFHAARLALACQLAWVGQTGQDFR